jgi:hypothetical protein
MTPVVVVVVGFGFGFVIALDPFRPISSFSIHAPNSSYSDSLGSLDENDGCRQQRSNSRECWGSARMWRFEKVYVAEVSVSVSWLW